jgi:RNA polymerase sigma-70 factor (ECF subfamily)
MAQDWSARRRTERFVRENLGLPPKKEEASALDPQEGQHHSAEEAEEAIRGLPDLYWLRLRRWAMWKLYGNSIESADEVIAEIWERFIQELRHWPVSVSIDACFWNAVKSRISGVWDKHRRQAAKQHAPVTAEREPADPLEDVEGTIEDPLEELVGTEERQRLQKIADHIENNFKADDAVTAVIIGRDNNMSPAEVQETFGLTETEYKSACKKLRRFINKHYPNGWESYEQRQQEPEGLA